MSTKIYNAYKYQGNIQQLFDDLKIIRKEVRESINELCLVVAREYYADDEGKLKEKALYDEMNRQMKLTYPSYSDEFAFGATSVVIYPYNNALYVQFFGTDVGFNMKLRIPHLQKMMESGKLRDYHYQNQTDPYYDWNGTEHTDIEYATLEEDWERRKITWDEIYTESSIPKFSGLTFPLYNEFYHMYHYVVDNFNKKVKDE